MTREEGDSVAEAFRLAGMAGKDMGEFEGIFEAEALDAGAPGFKATLAFDGPTP